LLPSSTSSWEEDGGERLHIASDFVMAAKKKHQKIRMDFYSNPNIAGLSVLNLRRLKSEMPIRISNENFTNITANTGSQLA
jgi:hypothetical protein